MLSTADITSDRLFIVPFADTNKRTHTERERETDRQTDTDRDRSRENELVLVGEGVREVNNVVCFV